MSNIELTEVKGKTKGKIKGVTFAFIKLQEGGFKYQSKDKEYSLNVVVDKATAKDFKKKFPKNGFKEIDTKDFEAKYKIAPLFPEEDEQYVLKFSADVALTADGGDLKAGDEIPYSWGSRPKVFVPVEGGVEDVTMSILVANGSKGDVAFNVVKNSFGEFPQLTGILVTDLIEYQSSGSATSDFGAVVGGLKAGDGSTQQKADLSSKAPVDEDTDPVDIPLDDEPEDGAPF